MNARPASDDVRRDALELERSARLRAEDLNRRKDQFIATAVHELRQPLAPMRAALDVMKHRVSRESDEHARHVVERQVAQLVRLIDDLMDASRVNESKTRLQRRPMDLREVVKDAIDALEPVVRSKHQSICLITPGVGAMADIDDARIQQVFTNLLSNASKFSADGQVIQVTVTLDDLDVRVDIQDQGRGIAPETLPHVFEIFRQSTAGESGGLGIGLFIVHGLVALHGGSVEAHSAGVGFGSTFTVRLPLMA